MTHHKPFGELSDAEKGALLLAHHEGKRIEAYAGDGQWMSGVPHWHQKGIYRIAPEPLVPDSIDWSHVAPEYNFMARDHSGDAYLFEDMPVASKGVRGRFWDNNDGVCSADHFASYRRGTVDWKDSLVIRPRYEGS